MSQDDEMQVDGAPPANEASTVKDGKDMKDVANVLSQRLIPIQQSQ